LSLSNMAVLIDRRLKSLAAAAPVAAAPAA